MEETTQNSSSTEESSKSNSSQTTSRLVVFALLGLAVFSSIYAAQKVNSKKVVPAEKVSGAVTLTPTPTAETEEKEASERCIVTLMGKKYDVTDFRELHEGGNLFVCGTDMTEKYIGKHGKDEKRPSLLLIDDKGNFVNKK